MIATSRAVANLPGLANLLETPVVHRWSAGNPAACGGVIAWGRKPSASAAASFAARHGLSVLRLEDGFLRSVELGNREPPLSIVLDDSGIYYDATAPSRLESLVAAAHTDEQQSRARALMVAWRAARISKYNFARDYEGTLPARYVLVADQTRGDASIRYGLADDTSFQRMLDAALAEHPDCTVLLKVHPEVMAGRKRGHFDLAALARNPRIRLLGEDAHPVSLIEHAEAIYAVTSQIGFEGLLWGKPVRTFGMPFYAGWGLTRDALPAPERRKPVSLENLIHAALLEYPRYIDPETGLRCEAERVVEWMALQRRMRARFPATVYAQGFSLYKRATVRSFFQGSRVRFIPRSADIPADSLQVVWGRRDVPAEEAMTIRLEDGFIRSVGLGADLVRPLSWVMDRQGIYYDATRPSDLELILQNTRFDDGLLARAHTLRERLVADGLTKYNVGTSGWQRPENRPLPSGGESLRSAARRVILVPGQVETDASLAYGAPDICRNLDLLRAVRTANPDAYVVYKPHPDVVAGLRRKGVGETDTARWCDEVLVDASMGELLLSVDEVHTLTSLAGFEALLRGKRVVCYGQPFYAGWGLTRDMLPVTRRARSLSLNELVAGVLILYPAYISRTTQRYTTPERALDELLSWRTSGAAAMPWWGGMYRFLVKHFLRQP
ncbi:MAG: capsular polysaccharide biosynthesis protein [Nitrosomonadales bacterium]|nr:capsular polysaccharide biosynthesis protein [Nitrosomonadales bacterium]